MTEHLNSEHGPADRANHSVDCVPDRIHPRNFVREKFEEIENASDRDDPRVTEHFERLILRRQSDPVKMDCKSSNENREVKIDPGERSETEGDSEQVQLFHGEL